MSNDATEIIKILFPIFSARGSEKTKEKKNCLFAAVQKAKKGTFFVFLLHA